MPSRPPIFSRRRMLAGAAVLATVGATAMTSTACGTAPPMPDLDDLRTALERARSDNELATEAATARGAPVDALAEVAAQRSAHAEALADEIVRLTGQAAPTTSTTSTTEPSTSVDPPAPTVDDVVAALQASAEGAARAAGALSGYRAGLLGSIAAACTTSYSVALTPEGGAR